MNGHHQSTFDKGRGIVLDMQDVQSVPQAGQGQEYGNPEVLASDREGFYRKIRAFAEMGIERMTAAVGIKDVFVVLIDSFEGEEKIADIGAVAGALFFGGLGVDAYFENSVCNQNAPSPEMATRIVLIRMVMSSHSDQFLI